MKLKALHCKHCDKDVAAVGSFNWCGFLIFFAIGCIIPILMPIILIMACFNFDYHCPHCGKKLL